MGIDDVSIPDALGAAPIVVDVPAFAQAHYHGANYDLTLHQGKSPSVTLPDGVDLSQLGKAALRAGCAECDRRQREHCIDCASVVKPATQIGECIAVHKDAIRHDTCDDSAWCQPIDIPFEE